MSNYIAICTIIIVFLIFSIWKLKIQSILYKKNYISFSNVFGKHTLPLVPILYNSQLYYLLVDTGANINVLSGDFLKIYPDLFDNLKDANLRTSGIGVSNVEKKCFLTFLLGNTEYTNIDFYVHHELVGLADINKNLSAPVIGIIGSNFLHQYNCGIDFQKMVIWVQSSRGK